MAGGVEDCINTTFLYFLPTGILLILFNHRHGLLVDSKSFRLILAGSASSFILGLVLHFTSDGRNTVAGGLLNPLVSLWLFRGLRCLFLRRFGREPQSTFLNWNEGLAPDRFFDFAYFIVTIGLWVLLAVVIG